ncbi:MAG: T9SS type A sorting domain-containing protein [Bacteroidia bacterium]
MSRIISIFLFVFLTINLVKADQLVGTIITYKSIGNLKYEVNYSVYIDRFVRNKPDTIPFKTLTFMVYSGKASVANFPKLTALDTLSNGCDKDARISILKKYKDTIDINLPLYAFIKSSGNCRIYFGCKYPERYMNLKNLPPSPYFSYAFVNTCNAPNGSSAESYVTEKINYFRCVNQSSYHSFFSYGDNATYDSISYHLVNPLKDFNSKIAFSSGYSKEEQMDVYWPAGYNKLLGPDQSANPPIGFSIDTIYGYFIFTPTALDAEYSLSNETIEYSNIGGKNREEGGFMNDFVIRVTECPLNNPPILNGPYKFEVDLEKEICFTITSDDKQFIPPPPGKPSPPDTVRLTWNRAIPGATFTIIDPKTRLQKAKFCWTPKLKNVSDLPYTFTVTANDNSCPNSAKLVKSYSVKVKKVQSVSNIAASSIVISPNPSTNGQLSIKSGIFKINTVELLDITGKQINTWDFESTSEFQIDLNHLPSGMYFIKCSNGGEVFNFKWIRQ